ncbi:MAG: C4-dicarboxylate transporter DctA [Acidocella sp. 20-57-95]|nr:MAG: C4-dicarboxylate transporter DctA [Acidocella sp. 20-57-95]OYV48760.1 MAG: C4-dicarboxylate transporter DctA [Burkholderiales bacterium 21-58-4]HQT63845.1 C4-dicarboxylate transporter DctA [Acidocella sp.]
MSTNSLAASPLRPKRPFYMDLSFQVIAGMLIGVLAGYLAPKFGVMMQPFATAFLRLIQMVTGPIIFCAIVSGIAGVTNKKQVGSVLIKALVYFEIVTSIALIIGLLAVNILKPGVGMNIDAASLKSSATVTSLVAQSHSVVSLADYFVDVIPTSSVGAFANGSILQILFFAVLFAFGLSSAGEKAAPLLNIIHDISKIFFWIVGIAMKLAPIAAFAAIAYTVGKFGVATLLSLGALIFDFYLTCVLFFVFVLFPISYFSGFSFWKLLKYIRAELFLVFGTSSSESVFPQLIRKMEEIGCEESVVGLVMPTAYSFNHDGTCLYFAAAAVFLAQATNTPLSLPGQLGLLAILLLTSKGGAGVAGSALVVLAATLAATNTIPVASIAIILGIHRVLSSAFVVTNIAGNAVATVVISGWEKRLNREQLTTQLSRA